MLYHGKSSFRNQRERVLSEVKQFLNTIYTKTEVIPELEFNYSFLDEWRLKYKKWPQIIEKAKQISDGKITDSSRQTGACYVIRCFVNDRSYVFAFNPICRFSISFVQDRHGFHLNTSDFSSLEECLIKECTEIYGGIKEIPKSLYSATIQEFGSKSVVDLLFQEEVLIYRNRLVDDQTTSLPKVITIQNHTSIIQDIRQFVLQYHDFHLKYYIWPDHEDMEEIANGFQNQWFEIINFIKYLNKSTLDPTISPLSGYIVRIPVSDGHYLFGISPFLPYWISCIQTLPYDGTFSKLVDETESSSQLNRAINSHLQSILPKYNRISLSITRVNIPKVVNLKVGEILFGERWLGILH